MATKDVYSVVAVPSWQPRKLWTDFQRIAGQMDNLNAFGRDPDLCYWIIILSLAMTMKQIERFQVSLSGFCFIGVNDTEFLNMLILALFVLRELCVCVSTCVLPSTSFPRGVHQVLPWMPKTSAATSQQESGPYLLAVMKLPGWWHGWWSGRAPASTVTHSGKLIAVYLCVCLIMGSISQTYRKKGCVSSLRCSKNCVPGEMEGRQVFSVQGDWNALSLFIMKNCSLFCTLMLLKKICCCDAVLFRKTLSYFGCPFLKLFHRETPRHSILRSCLMNTVYLCQLALEKTSNLD